MHRITLYIKKRILTGRDFRWLQVVIQKRTKYNHNTPVTLKMMGPDSRIDELMTYVTNPSTGWTIVNQQVSTQNGNPIIITNVNNREVQLIPILAR